MNGKIIKGKITMDLEFDVENQQFRVTGLSAKSRKGGPTINGVKFLNATRSKAAYAMVRECFNMKRISGGVK